MPSAVVARRRPKQFLVLFVKFVEFVQFVGSRQSRYHSTEHGVFWRQAPARSETALASVVHRGSVPDRDAGNDAATNWTNWTKKRRTRDAPTESGIGTIRLVRSIRVEAVF